MSTDAPPPTGALRALHEDRRGAVLVEFAVALMPLLATFFVSLQTIQLATARLVVKHATILGARAGAVFANTKGITPDQPVGVNQDNIEYAVMGACSGRSRSRSRSRSGSTTRRPARIPSARSRSRSRRPRAAWSPSVRRSASRASAPAIRVRPSSSLTR